MRERVMLSSYHHISRMQKKPSKDSTILRSGLAATWW